MRFLVEPEAVEELEEAAAYLDERAPGAGERFLGEVERAKQLLLQFPRAGSTLRGPYRRVLLRTFPYQVIYRAEADAVRVYAVAHLKRRTGYWRKRLPRQP